MPSYTVTDPTSGKTVTLTGDSPPTEQELEQIFSSLPDTKPAQAAPVTAADVPVFPGAPTGQASIGQSNAPEPTMLDKLSAGGKALGVMAGNAIPATIGALGGSAYGLISGQGAEEMSRGAQQFSPFKTDDPLANQYMESAGQVLGALDPGFVGGLGMASAGTAKAAGQQAKSAIGDAAAATGSAIKNEIDLLKPAVSKDKLDIINKIKSGSTENDLAQYELKVANPKLKDAQGNLLPQAYKVVDDDVAKQAIGQEWEPGTIQSVKNFDDKSAAIAKRMLEVANRGTKDDTFKANNRPISELGDEISKQLAYIRRVNRDAGNAINETAKSLKNEKVDVAPAVDRFIESISDDLGVTITPSKEGVLVDFRGSNLEGNTPEIRSAQGVVKNLVNRMYSTRTPSAYDVHRLKGYIDTQASYGSQLGGLKGKTDRIVKNLRHDLDSVLDENFPEYNSANTVYAETKNALDTMQELVGKKIDLRQDYASQSLGKLSRRMLSNAQSAERVREAAININDVATRYGAEDSGNIPALVKFADTLDKQFGVAADTSLAAEVAKGVTQSKKDAAINIGTAIIQKAKGVNNERKYRTMNELLNRQRIRRLNQDKKND